MLSNKFRLVFYLLAGIGLAACSNETSIAPQEELNTTIEKAGTENPKVLGEVSKETQEVIKNRCINRKFRQGVADNLYGKECVEGKYIRIQTSSKGEPVPTFTVTSEKGLGIELEGDLTFTNQIHKLSYTISKNEGSDRTIPWLRDLIPPNMDFLGRPDTEYSIVFKVLGNYLVLFKASEDKNHLPYIEQTSLSQDGKLYMVPFIGYPIQYCHPRLQKDEDGEEKWLSEPNCGTSQSAESSEYISFQKDNGQTYKYLKKNNLFPSDYFEGRWIFTQSPIETPNMQEVSPHMAFLVDMEKMSKTLNIQNISGDIDENRKKTLRQIPVRWLSFEMAREGDTWEHFGERETKHGTVSDIEKPYLTIQFDNIKGLSPGERIENYMAVSHSNPDVVKIKLSQDSFSYVFEQPIQPCGKDQEGKTVCIPTQQRTAKIRYSFLREEALDQEGFVPRRWFKDDHDHVFGVFWAFPQKDFKMGETAEMDILDHARMMRFNLSLNSPEEKASQTKKIIWHFSKNSTKNPEYRELFKQAIDIYDRAFEIIMKGSGKKVRVLLDETEERDLGDLEANVLNAIYTEGVSPSGLLGRAPSYVHPETGQTIGTTVNVYIQNIEQIYINKVKSYIRYEIFQADKGEEAHPVSPYLRAKIKDQCEQCKPCPEVDAFIRQKKRSGAMPRDYLNDKEVATLCAKKIAKDHVLANIIHEMGHSFSLGHNFKASVDKDNYYHSIEEVKKYFPMTQAKKMAKLSSAMDYSPLDMPEITVLGKYDLAALRFIYRDQVETTSGDFASLNIDPQNPQNHKPLSENILSQMKVYQHCSDFVAELERQNDFLCIRFDYGSNPEEIVNYYIKNAKRALSQKYRYDSDNSIFIHRPQRLTATLSFYFGQLLGFYSRWIQSRNKYLKNTNNIDITKYILDSEEALEEYRSVIQKGLLEKKDDEYALYYPIREIIPHFIMDFLFTPSMKCQINRGNKTWDLNLESIKSYLIDKYHENLYVEDCYSPMITDFLNQNGLTLGGQTGFNLFNSYYSEGTKASLEDVVPWPHVFTTVHRTFALEKPMYWNAISAWTLEPDFFALFREKIMQEIQKTGHSVFDLQKISILFLDYQQNLKKTLPKGQYYSLHQSHFDDLSHIKFQIGTGEKSFYKKFLDPFQKGMKIEDMGIPFLIKAFDDYDNGENLFDFQTYIRERDDTIDPNAHSMGHSKNQTGNYFIIPKISDNFAAKIIKEYNAQTKELGRLRALEEERDLTPLEKILKMEAQIKSEYLMTLAQSVEYNH